MAVAPEAIEKILNFRPRGENGEPISVLQHVDLGMVDGKRVGYGPKPYRRRVIVTEGEPLTPHITIQPVVYLEDEGRVLTTLAYRTDIEAIGDLAQKVADHIKVVERRQKGLGSFVPGS